MAWRDKIEVHEATNYFPMMTEAELKELALDIAENGLRVGLVLWTPELPDQVSTRKGPQKLYLLDGRNRLEAIERAYSSAEEVDEAIDEALDPQAGLSASAPAKIVFGDEDPLAYVISANIRRRHLTVEQKREIIIGLKQERPELSTRAIASITGVPQTSVRRALSPPPGEPSGSPGNPSQFQGDRKSDSSRPPIEQPDIERGEAERVIGQDGKSYPARRPSAEVVQLPTASTPQPEPRRPITAREANASDKRVETFIRAAKNLSDSDFLVAAKWFDEYRIERGKSISKSTRSGKQ